MRLKKNTYHIFFFLIFWAATISLHAQSVNIIADKNQILIGEQINYELIINLPADGYSINFNLPDTIAHFETLMQGDFDTMSTNGNISLHKKITFTSFDSGAWYIPAFPVTLEKNTEIKKIMTDSILINVGYSPADSTNELRDIKPIIEIKVGDYFYYYLSGGILLAILLAIILYNYFSKKKQKPLPVLHSAISAFDEAMKDLKELSGYNLQNPADVKQYHTQLGFILKRYYSRLNGEDLLNKTTDGFLIRLKEQPEESALIITVAESLRISDAVKFAKYIPPVAESEKSLQQVKKNIEQLDKNKPNKN